ncbi:hypothetical protein GT039_08605, partial [Streptomyces sp. SID2955]|nr:hypothetical protein [Streptomyces sp. SID2955]
MPPTARCSGCRWREEGSRAGKGLVRVTSLSTPRPDADSGTVAAAVEELRAGRPVIVVDDADREDEGDLVLA